MNKNSGNDLISNLTGGQIQEVLDHLILESISPIIRTSDIFDHQVIYLLTLCAKNKKRKISALPRNQVISLLSQYLMETSPDNKIILLSKAKIERGFLFTFIVRYLSELSEYRSIYSEHITAKNNVTRSRLNLKLRTLERFVENSRNSLFQTIETSNDYLNLAYEFRNSIVTNYIKFAYKYAQVYCKAKGKNYDFDDVHQNFIAIIAKAIDKYDSAKGALTSYIKWWILNAQSNVNTDFGHEYGIAYTIPQVQRKNIAGGSAPDTNFSVSLDQKLTDDNDQSLDTYLIGDVGVDNELEQDEIQNHLSYLIKQSDINGLARLYLDLNEYFSNKELHRMKKIMLKQLGKNYGIE